MICWLILIFVFSHTGCNTAREAAPVTPVAHTVPNAIRSRTTANKGHRLAENASASEYKQSASDSKQQSSDNSDQNNTLAASRPTENEEDKSSPEENTEHESPADRDATNIDDILGLDGTESVSVGSTGNGHLIGGVALPKKGPGFLHNPRRPEEARFATAETVQAIIRSATEVAEAFPESTLVVNDLCLREGGPIAQHGSHQNGRDADILFYYLDSKRKPVPSVGVPLDPRGWGWDFKDLTIAKDDVRLQLDVKRTWRFMQALLENSGDLVQRIFIVEHLRTLLIKEAERVKAPKKTLARFEQVTCQPSTPHDDHMHVRFFCAADDIKAGCLDNYPIYPWHRESLRELGVEPIIAKPDRRQRKAAKKRTTSPAQARKRAGRMHRRVKMFLDQRENWLPNPHPGRPYCR